MEVQKRSAVEGGPEVRMGTTRRSDPDLAAVELAGALSQPRSNVALIFASSLYDPDELGPGLGRAFGQTRLIGCTTAGEIGPGGYQAGSLSGVSFCSDDIDFESGLLEGLDAIDQRVATAFANRLRDQLLARHPNLDPEHCFALMLIDGLCVREEIIARGFQDGLGGIPLVGGSAGDDLVFKETRVLFDGRFVRNAAVLLVGISRYPLAVFKTQHFVPTGARMVVTGAIPEQRVVTEINGNPAAAEYARILGMDPANLDSQAFSANPVMVRIGGTDFVRSIQKVNPDGTLTFFCAIDRGIVFKLARGRDMDSNLEAALDDVVRRIGTPTLVIGCDCILRRLECQQKGLVDTIGSRLAGAKVIGFSTFGEQFRGMHINQTFTGIAFGKEAAQ